MQNQTNTVQIVVTRVTRPGFITYRFSNMEQARRFVCKFNLEDKVVDVL